MSGFLVGGLGGRKTTPFPDDTGGIFASWKRQMRLLRGCAPEQGHRRMQEVELQGCRASELGEAF